MMEVGLRIEGGDLVVKGERFKVDGRLVMVPLDLLRDVKHGELPRRLAIETYYEKQGDTVIGPIYTITKGWVEYEVLARQKYWEAGVPLSMYMEAYEALAKSRGLKTSREGGWGLSDDYFILTLSLKAWPDEKIGDTVAKLESIVEEVEDALGEVCEEARKFAKKRFKRLIKAFKAAKRPSEASAR